MLDDTLATLIASETPSLFADLLLDRAHVLRTASRDEEAREALATALSLFEHKRNLPAARRTRALMAGDPAVV
jgi:hypothetical protein